MNAVASAVCGLVFVLGLIFFMNWLLRRFGGALCARTGRKSEIVLLDVKALDAKNKLVLARCRGKEFLPCPVLRGEAAGA